MVLAALVLAALALAAAAALALAASGGGEDVDRGRAGGPAHPASSALPAPAPATLPAVPVSVQVQASRRGRTVPAQFLGLSFEASELAQIATFGASGNMVGLLRSLGPGLLRFGGVSADTRIAWTDAATPLPSWAGQKLQAADLSRLGVLARRSGWPVLLTVGLAHYSPTSAAREVAAARAALGPLLAGVEIGNEPDAYARHGFRSLPWTPARYDTQVAAYRRAIARVAAGVPLASPGVSGSHSFVRWGRSVARSARPALLTGHHYPLGCHQMPAPSIEGLLSAATRRSAALSLKRYMTVSRSTRIPFRMDEAGSVSCGGRAGISNTFAAALWATDYITQAMAAGVTGINFQGNPAYCLGYSPLCASSPAALARGTLTAQPVWYALLLTKALEGDTPLASRSSSAQQPNLAVRTMQAPDGTLHAVIIDDEPPGSPPAAVSLHVGAGYRAASVLALAAPSPQATSGVTLGGRQVRADGSWSAPAAATEPVTGGVLTVTVQPSSAALVTIAPAHPTAGG